MQCSPAWPWRVLGDREKEPSMEEKEWRDISVKIDEKKI